MVVDCLFSLSEQLFFRSVFSILIHAKNIGLGDIIRLGFFNSMYNYILSVRIGEFSYVHYLRSITNTLGTERLFLSFQLLLDK